MDGGHQTFLDTEAFLEKDMDNWSETVGSTTGVGNDIVTGYIKLVVVNTHNHGNVLAFGGSGNDDLLGTCAQVTLGLFGICEKTCAFEHNIDAEILPRKSGRAFLDGEAFDLVSVDDKRVILGDIGRRFFTVNFALETALNGVVFDEVG